MSRCIAACVTVCGTVRTAKLARPMQSHPKADFVSFPSQRSKHGVPLLVPPRHGQGLLACWPSFYLSKTPRPFLQLVRKLDIPEMDSFHFHLLLEGIHVVDATCDAFSSQHWILHDTADSLR